MIVMDEPGWSSTRTIFQNCKPAPGRGSAIPKAREQRCGTYTEPRKTC